MRVIALLATYNEERFIGACLEHLIRQGVDVYIVDNSSTDQTVPIATGYLDRGVVGIEKLARAGIYTWRRILERKEQLAATLEADWFMHVDTDEIRLPPRSDVTLARAFAEVDAQGYNAVNFLEYTFVPTLEAPEHDHPRFQETMRWYYPYLPESSNQMKAWRRQPGPVELAWSGGHQVRFPGLRMYPESFPMRHYLYLSVAHATKKFIFRRYDPQEVSDGWHQGRATLVPAHIKLTSQAELRRYSSDDKLDPTDPRTTHFLFDRAWTMRQRST